ncbi:U6 snRNP-associated protein Lsm7 [Sorochytrium milnesiophthora]
MSGDADQTHAAEVVEVEAGGDRKRENILDLKQYQDKQIRVKFQGGREVVGTLKGFDPLMNLVLDDTVEYLQDAMPSDPNQTRKLGLVVARGPLLVLISPVEGAEEIENPFLQGDDEAVEQEAS